MDQILGLLVIALILLAAEIFVPGGVLATAGILCLLGISALIWIHHGATLGLAAILGSIVVALGMLWLELTWLKHSRFGRHFFLTTDLSEKAQKVTPAQDSVIGKGGITITRMTPIGVVEVEGQRFEATSQSGMLHQGIPIVVVARDAFRVVVRTAESQISAESSGR